VLALVLVILAVVSVIALFAPDAGFIVAPWARALSYLLGWGIAFAAPLLAGFALMLWMKSMQSERWMAASGAVLVALSLLGMFHLVAGGGRRLVDDGEGGGILGYGVSTVARGAVGDAGAWIVLVIFFVVGLLLYFNMTIGDLVAAWLQRREERAEEVEAEARRAAAQRGRRAEVPTAQPAEPAAEGRGLLGRVRDALARGEQDEPPLIVRRARPEAANGAGPGAVATGRAIPREPVAAQEPDGDEGAQQGAAFSEADLESTEEAHLAEVGEHEVRDAALEGTTRTWDLPDLSLLDDASASARRSRTSASGSRWRASRRGRSSRSTRSTSSPASS
jgi:hypothetical protein